MRRFLLVFCGLLLFNMAGLADTIYLKNGRQIECASAWEEGKEIKYVVGTGKIGIPKSMVAKIVKGPPPNPAPDPQTQTQTRIAEKVATEQAALSEVAKIYVASGDELIRKKDYPGALESFLKAYRLRPDSTIALRLAATYFFLNDDWNAELYFNQLLSANPKDTEALNYLGEIAWRNERLTEAEEYWQKSLDLKSDPMIREKLKKVQKERNASEQFENVTTRHFLIRYDSRAVDSSLVREMSDFLEDLYRQFAARFDNYPDDPFIVVLYPRQKFFRATELPFWAGGANDGKIRLPIKGISTLNTELKDVLAHEMTHSFLRIKTSNNCPVWLQEGLAQYSEGKRTGEDNQQVLAQLAAQNQLPPVRNLAGSFLESDGKVASLLYLESLAFTEYLLNRFPSYQMNEALDEMGKQKDYAEAFERIYGESIGQLESDWHRSLR